MDEILIATLISTDQFLTMILRGLKGKKIMTDKVNRPPKPQGLLKWVFILRRYLYSWHLGWLLGHRFVLLTHQGARTGRKYETVLEVVHYDPVVHEYWVLSIYGERADWYRNIQAHPPFMLQVGIQRYIPQQRLLTTEEVISTFRIYKRRYSWVFASVLRKVGYQYDGSPESFDRVARAIRGVAFHP